MNPLDVNNDLNNPDFPQATNGQPAPAQPPGIAIGSQQAPAAMPTPPPSNYSGMTPQETANAKAAVMAQVKAGTLSQAQADTAIAGLPQSSVPASAPVPAPVAKDAKDLLPPPTAQPTAQPTASGPSEAELGSFLQTRQTGGVPLSAYKKDLDDKTKINAEHIKSLDEATAAQEEANRQRAEQSQTLLENSTIARLQFEHDQKELADRRNKVSKDYDGMHSKINAQLDELDAKGLDPKRYFKNAGTAANIGNALTIGLTQFGQGLARRSGNPALDIVNKQIDDDIESQKYDMDKAYKVLSKRGELANNKFDANLAMIRAEGESKLSAWTVADRDLDRQAKLLGDNYTANTAFQQMKLGIQEKIAEVKKTQTDQEMNYQVKANPVRSVGPNPEQRKAVLDRAQKQFDDANTAGKPISWTEALQRGAQQGLGIPVGGERSDISHPQKGDTKTPIPMKPDLVQRLTSMPSQSTNWSPVSRNVQGTGEFANKQELEQTQAAMRARLSELRYSPRIIENVVKPFLPQAGDSEDTLRRKAVGFANQFGNNAIPQAAGTDGSDGDK
jgi:hypothetical protein